MISGMKTQAQQCIMKIKTVPMALVGLEPCISGILNDYSGSEGQSLRHRGNSALWCIKILHGACESRLRKMNITTICDALQQEVS